MLKPPLKILVGALFAACACSSFAFDVTAQSAVIMDAGSGKILWSKDPDTARYPASTTKIMTAMLLIEHCQPDEVITAPEGVDKVTGSSLHLVPGEQITASEILYGIMLRSANDACVAVATHVSGSVPAFVELMNARAKEIGCTNTHFNNPNGLNDDLHMISARDLALIAREAMKYPRFREVVSQRKHELIRSVNTQDRFLENHNKYLAADPTADGIKTGWTVPAGQCYVGSATRNGYRVITVVLKSDNWKTDHTQMLDYAFSNCEHKVVAEPGTSYGVAKISDGITDKVQLTVPAEVQQAYFKDAPADAQIVTQIYPNVKAPVTAGQQLGTVTFTDPQGWQETEPLVAVTAVPKGEKKPMTGVFLFAGGIGSGAYLLKRKNRRKPVYGKYVQKRQVKAKA